MSSNEYVEEEQDTLVVPEGEAAAPEGAEEGYQEGQAEGQEETQEGEVAEQEEGAEEEGEGESREKKKKKKKKKRSAFIEDEAILSGSEVDSSEEEDGDSQNEYEYDDFTVPTGMEEEGREGGGGGERRRRRKKKRRHEETLEEDDYDLVRENTGQNIARRKQDSAGAGGGNKNSKKLKRLKQMGNRTDLYSNIQSRLFGDDDDEAGPSEAITHEEPRSDDELDDEDEDDFIVGADGKPIKRSKQRRYRGGEDRGALQDAEDIFGSVDFFKQASGRRSRPRGDEFDDDGDYVDGTQGLSEDELDAEIEEGDEKQKDPLADIYEHYEPSLLEQKHFTSEDEKIRQLDVPERLQMRKGTAYDEKLVPEEAEWIFTRAFARTHATDKAIIIQRIIHVLRFLQEQLLEVPFISTYRKDYYQPLKISELWDIYDWDEKWAHLQARKNNIMQMCRMLEGNPNHGDELREYMELLRDGQTEEDLSDLQDYFQMFYADEVRESAAHAESGKVKRALRRDLYTTAKRNGLGDFAKKFGITPKEFGDNLMDNYATHTPIDNEEDPEALAQNYLCKPFPDTESVLKAARVMCAQEIAFDIHVRQSVRSVYVKRAILSTVPTLKGKKDIDAFHPYMIIKQMDKPAMQMEDFQMLLVLKAEKEGFITTKIHTDEKDVLQEMDTLYTSDGTSATAEAWNNHRREILALTLRNYLFPLFARELRAKLTQEAQNFVAYDVSRRLEQQLLVAPWAPEEDDSTDAEEEDDTPRRMRIIATCRGGLGEPTMAVVLDDEGEVVEYLKLSFLNERRTNADGRDSTTDLKNLEKFVQDHQPRAIIVAAENLECRRYYEDIMAIVQKLRGSRELRKQCKVMYGDAELARAFKQSHRGISEFPEYPPLLRQAISLGRKLLDPVTEFANSCDDANGHFVLRMHDLQDMVPQDRLAKSIHRVFINVVNAVGADVNRMLTHKYANASLQYVSGLGVRKAEYLLQAIFRKGRSLASRDELTSFVDKCVFMNCAGFIRIRDKHFYNENVELEPLDDTRIHPEDYRLARKMAADALDREGEDAVLQECIYAIMEKPKKLDDIDLDAFATMLESSGEIKKMTLYDIKKELTHQFADIRTKYTDPTNVDIFHWLTGETDNSLAAGMIIAARAFRQSERSVLCRLESGLIGFINSENVSDDREAASSSTIAVGQTVHARVLSIDKDKFSLRLSCRGSDLDNPKWEYDKYEELKKLNKFLVIELEPNKDEPKKEAVRRTTWNVHHPLFQDTDFIGAEKFLADKPIGEVVIRPSSKAPDHLTFSWKFFDGVYIHTDVQVRDKKSARSLGSLFIGENKYDDLDEIVARYMDPINFFVLEMINYRKFKRSSQQEVDQLVTFEKGASPTSIPYYITAPKEHPGRFEITYMPSTRLKHEFITVNPEGFSFRKQPFKSVEQLIKWFKLHYRDPILPPKKADEKPPTPAPTPAQLQQLQQMQTQQRMSTPQINATPAHPGAATPAHPGNATPAHPGNATPAHQGSGWANAAQGGNNFPGMQAMQQNLPATSSLSLWGGWDQSGTSTPGHSQGGAGGWNNNNTNNYGNNNNAFANPTNDVTMGWEDNYNNNNNNSNNYGNSNSNYGQNDSYGNNRDDRSRRDNNSNNYGNNRDNYGNNRGNSYRDNNNYNSNRDSSRYGGGGYGGGGRDNYRSGGGGGGGYGGGSGGGYGGDRNRDSRGGRDNYNNNRRDDRDYNRRSGGGGGGGYGGDRNRDSRDNRGRDGGRGWDDRDKGSGGGGGGGGRRSRGGEGFEISAQQVFHGLLSFPLVPFWKSLL
eukprot:Phypoly_transcript_00177.p1 GENE.Phypoly_transcript_00177~~Phypoly_transcript_00177.p1  ORF type:complete len:1792 (+),score=500.68 Phypoly_transcript_00177:82-5457(+)